MSDLRFDTGENEFGAPRQQSQGFDLQGKLIAWGLVSDRQTATYALVGVAILAIVGAYFLYGSLADGDAVPTTPVYDASQQQ